jgi:excisionase family DNA binding protein
MLKHSVVRSDFSADSRISNPDKSPLFDPGKAAEFLGISKETLAMWRCTKRYPLPYIKVGRLVRYREADLAAFLESRRVLR